MNKYLANSLMFKFAILFYLLFIISISPIYAGMDAYQKQHKRQDAERDMKHKKLKNTDISRRQIQALTKTLPVDTDNDGMPDSWESDNSLDSNNPDDAWYDPDGDKVVNLFEYQLGSDLNNSSTPQIVTVAQSGADYADVETAINSVSDGTVIRIAGGTYYVNYTTFDTKVVMIQGGWSSDFSKRNLKSYPTTFDGGMKDEILYFSASSGEPVIILDGINFTKGNGYFGAVNLLAEGSASMKTSIFNCSVTDSEGGTNSSGGTVYLNNWDSSQSDRTIGNTIISGNGTSGIESHITEEAITRWRIINTTISYNKNSEGDSGRGIDVFTLNNGVLTAHIYNSIIWGNKQYDLELRRNITFEVDHSDIDNVNTGSGAVYQSGDGVVNVDPLFVDPANNDFHLQSSSPVIDAGVNQGIPSLDYEGETRVSGTTVDMGADEYTTGVIYTTPTPTQTPTPTSTPTPTAAVTPTTSSGYEIGPDGGTIEITDSSSSLYGVKLEIPAGALEQECLITISDVTQEKAESDLDVFFSGSNLQFVKAVHIEMDPNEGFKKPIKIFIPYREDTKNDLLVVKGSSDTDLDENAGPDQILVDTAKFEDEYIVTSSDNPFPGITSGGTFLFLEPSNDVLFLKGPALNSSEEPVEGALVASVQGSGIFSMSQKDGSFIVNVNKGKTQTTTLIAKDSSTGLFGYYRQKKKKQKKMQVKYNDESDSIILNLAVDHKLSSKEKSNIKYDWARDTVSHPSPSFSHMLWDETKSLIENGIKQKIADAPTIPFDPKSAKMCTEEQRVFTANLGTYYNKKWKVGIDDPTFKMNVSLRPSIPIIPWGDPGVSVSAGLKSFSINFMEVNASIDIDDENVARIISQESRDTSYDVTIEAVEKGSAKLRGAILKLASVNVQLKFGFSITKLKFGPSILNATWWPFLDNAGLEKIGPADISVGEEIDVTNESPTGEISDKRPKISATIKSCNHEIDLSSIQMTLDGSLVEHTSTEGEGEVKISYTPDYDLAAGEHTVTVNASKVDGFDAKERKWTFSVSSEETGDLTGTFIIDVKYSGEECPFSYPFKKGDKTFITINATAKAKYKNKSTIIVSGSASGETKNRGSKLAVSVKFKFEFKNFISSKGIACKYIDYYGCSKPEKVSGSLQIDFNGVQDWGNEDDCSYTDSINISGLSLGHGIQKPFNGFSLDCDTDGIWALLFSFDGTQYLTELGGSLELKTFNLYSNSFFQ